MWRRSLRVNLILTFILLAVVPLLIVTAILNWNNYVVERDQVLELKHEIAKGASAQIKVFLEGIEDTLQVMVQVSDLTTVSEPEQVTILSNLLFYEQSFDELALVDLSGQEIVRVSRLQIVTAEDLRNRVSDTAFVAPLRTGQPFYGPIELSELEREPVSTISLPIVDVQTGEISAVLIGVVRFKQVWDVVAAIPVGETGSAYVVDDTGRVIAHRDPSLIFRQERIDLSVPDGIRAGLTAPEVVLARSPVRFGSITLYSVAELPVEEAFAPAFRNILTTTLALLLTLLLANIVGFFMVRRIVQPVETLATAAQAMSEGDLQQQVQINRQDEIGRLATTFNTMSQRLHDTLVGLEERVQERTQELETRNQELSTAYENLQAQQQRAETAEQTVLEMGSPVIPVLPRVLLVPLVGTMNLERMQQLTDALLHAVTDQQARVVLLDITGVPVIDTQVSLSITTLNQAVRLLGAQMLLIGVRPEIAQNIVALGVDLNTIETYSTLAEALSKLQSVPQRAIIGGY